MTRDTLDFLKRLLDTPGPSGFETAPARVWREEVKTFADQVTADVHGNSVAALHPEGTPRLMLAGQHEAGRTLGMQRCYRVAMHVRRHLIGEGFHLLAPHASRRCLEAGRPGCVEESLQEVEGVSRHG